MQLARRLRIHAVLCSLVFLISELISRPYANMGIDDDGPYSLVAKTLAVTGHIHYNGWSAPMLGWQLYLGAAFIKLFGFSFTTVRMSTLFVAVLTTFLLQRTLVRTGVTERNAALGTLAVVLSPLYFMVSVTFLTDITGLFALALCVYSCLRALQASTERATIAWLCFAAITNAIGGTSRQIDWLGVLVIVPSTLYLLRSRRRVLFAGALLTAAGALFISSCMVWVKYQPYTLPEHLIPSRYPVGDLLMLFTYSLLDLPYLLLPLTLLFLPQLRNLRPRTLAILALLVAGYIFLATYPSHLRGNFQLLPLGGSIGLGEWNNVTGMFAYDLLKGQAPIVIGAFAQVLLTLATFGGLFGLLASLQPSLRTETVAESIASPLWRDLSILLLPFVLAYGLIMIPRALDYGIRDRYLLELIVVALPFLLRYYQERIQVRLPSAAILMVGAVAIYTITMTHNMFSLYRARIAIAHEMFAAWVPDTAVDQGWEQNFVVEIHHAGYVNSPLIERPAHAYRPASPLPAGSCTVVNHEQSPLIRPLYGISFDPNACYGPAPFAPVHYSRWPYHTPGTLYVVRYLPPSA